MNINGLNWKIKYKKMDNEYHGYTQYSSLTIYINSNLKEMNPILFKRLIFHEITHAYFISYGLKYETNFEKEEMIEFYAHNIDNLNNLTNEAIKELNNVKRRDYNEIV